MTRSATDRHNIVLVGGGHTHVQVMRAFAQQPQPGAALTLVSDRRLTPYSGMLPGYIAGTYAHEAMHIDLHQLAQATGTRLVEAEACGLDRAARILHTRCGKTIAYDTLSLNLGITPDLTDIIGAERHGIAVKPISAFIAKFEALMDAAGSPNGPRRFAIIGGGAAGAELAFALRARLTRQFDASTPFVITLLVGAGLVPSLNACVQRKVRAALQAQGIAVVDGFRAAAIDANGIDARDGRRFPADAVLISTAARAPDWLRHTDLPLAADGSVMTARTLATIDDPRIFAVGDCGVVVDDPRPKAGVFAIRQAPSLVRNLRRRTRGEPLLPHAAQRTFLTILMAGPDRAIAGKGQWLCLEGRLVWRWKDWIDRRFMALFSR